MWSSASAVGVSIVIPLHPSLVISCKKDFNPWKPPNQSKKKPPHPLLAPKEKKQVAPFRHISSSPPGLGQFHPPPLPIYGDVPSHNFESSSSESSKERIAELVDILRGSWGSWQERAKCISKLHQSRLSAEELYDLAFVTPCKQTTMLVASQVYDSLVQGGARTEILNWFDEHKVELLYALRTLSSAQRKAAAEFVVRHDLDTREANDLARAIKDHERRPEGRQGFTPAPGDCLAFMWYRAAGECQDASERNMFVQRGLAVACSASAKQRLSQLEC